MNLLKAMFDEMNKHFDELNTKLDEREELMNKGFNKLRDVINKRDEKLEGDRGRLKENIEGELKQVSGYNGVNYNDESVMGVENGTDNKVSGCDSIKNNDGDMITNNNCLLYTSRCV